MIFSIIVPVYNVRNYLHEALDSLAKQKERKAEFILVNDGSTDGSFQILEEYESKDSRFHIIDGKNGGYGKAMNRGLKEAKGEYIGILEPDDYYSDDCLEKVKAHRGADIIKGNFTLFWDDPHKEKANKLKSDTWGECSLESNPILLVNNPSIWSAFYRRDFIEQSNILFPETPGASFQDLPFFWETFLCSKTLYVMDNPLYYYRQSNPNSSIKKKFPSGLILERYNRVQKRLEEVNENRREDIAPYVTAKTAEDLFWNLSNISLREMPRYLSNCRKIISQTKKDFTYIESRLVRIFTRTLFFNIKPR